MGSLQIRFDDSIKSDKRAIDALKYIKNEIDADNIKDAVKQLIFDKQRKIKKGR